MYISKTHMHGCFVAFCRGKVHFRLGTSSIEVNFEVNLIEYFH